MAPVTWSVDEQRVVRTTQVLFVHTGGLLGTFDKVAQLQPLVESIGKAHRMQVDGC